MCGIVGTYYYHKKNNDDEYLQWCLKTMQHRGPDSNGTWQHDNYATGFVRLAIQDISEHGNQPMISACGNYCLTFNGEIYNANNYKQQLIANGVAFTSTGDTEILLYTLIHFGLEYVLQEFDGMFAFAFYNVEKNELIIARDRVGIKPLYIGFNDDESIIYSSQYDHIINYKTLQKQQINQIVLSNYFQLGFVPDGDGIIKNTLFLPHGHYIKINKKGYKIHQYYKVQYKSVDENNTELKEDNIEESAKSQLISDVPLGTFLSGGIDSSLLTLLTNHIKPIKAYTISTNEEKTDEKERAIWFTKKFNIQHQVADIDKIDVEKLVDENIKAYTEPFADFSSLPSLLVSKEAKKNVTVILSGDGPDELFFGYNRNVKMIKLGKKFFRNNLLNIVEYFFSKVGIFKKTISSTFLKSKSFAQFYYNTMFINGSAIWAKKICTQFQPNYAFFFNNITSQSKKETNIDDAMQFIWNCEMNIHLQRILLKMDRASMYHSLEVRVPYLSNEIITIAQESCWKNAINNGVGKKNIKQILAKYTGENFVYAPKKGFDIPLADWIRTNLTQKIENCFNNIPNSLHLFINQTELKKMLHNHLIKKENNANVIWAAFTFIEWYKMHRYSYKN